MRNKIEPGRITSGRITFGPIPSRRLGRSLGINHIPPKICTYSCVYCQVGKTLRLTNKRQVFYDPEEIRTRVVERVKELRKQGERVDYLSFVPDGEPTLDTNLGKEIGLLKNPGKGVGLGLDIPVAVITNGTLITIPEVREDLKKADWVSFKVDSVTERCWRRIDRPHPALNLSDILSGMIEFSKDYKGELNTETMLIQGINDDEGEIKRISEFINKLAPVRAYISIPTRPPALKLAKPPSEEMINRAYNIFRGVINRVELLIGYEGNEFAGSGNVRNDILDITAVHPMKEEAVREMLKKTGEGWEIISDMIDRGEIIETSFAGSRFFMRTLPEREK